MIIDLVLVGLVTVGECGNLWLGSESFISEIGGLFSIEVLLSRIGGRSSSPGTEKRVSTWLLPEWENPERGRWAKSEDGEKKDLNIYNCQHYG